MAPITLSYVEKGKKIYSGIANLDPNIFPSDIGGFVGSYTGGPEIESLADVNTRQVIEEFVNAIHGILPMRDQFRKTIDVNTVVPAHGVYLE